MTYALAPATAYRQNALLPAGAVGPGYVYPVSQNGAPLTWAQPVASGYLSYGFFADPAWTLSTLGVKCSGWASIKNKSNFLWANWQLIHPGYPAPTAADLISTVAQLDAFCNGSSLQQAPFQAGRAFMPGQISGLRPAALARPAGQATDGAVVAGMGMASLLAIALSIGVAYAGSYYGAKAALKR